MNWLKNKNKDDTRRIVADKIVKNPDGTMDVTITFNPFEHGHFLGRQRNYAIEKYKKMVENPKTQLHIKNGYAIGTYTHDYRTSSGVLKNRDENGNPIEPCCKTIAMEWVEPHYVRHTQRIANNETGKKIQKLIEAGIGGFSSVHNLNTGDFYGFDYVIYPNFATNRVVADNSCEMGMCSLNKDDVVSELENIIKQKAEFVVDSLGIEDDRDEIISTIEELERQTPEYQLEKKLAEEIEKAKDQIKEEFEEEKGNLIKQIEELKKIIEKKEEEKEALKDNLENKILKLENEILKKENFINKLTLQLDGLDLEVVGEEVKPKENFLDTIFKKANLEEEVKLSFDDIKILKLKKHSFDDKIEKLKQIWGS